MVAFCLLRTIFVVVVVVVFLIFFLLVLETHLECKLFEVVSKKRKCFLVFWVIIQYLSTLVL